MAGLLMLKQLENLSDENVGYFSTNRVKVPWFLEMA
jgi:hypothetical protein